MLIGLRNANVVQPTTPTGDDKTEAQRLEFHEARFCSYERGFPEKITSMHFITMSESSPLKPQK